VRVGSLLPKVETPDDHEDEAQVKALTPAELGRLIAEVPAGWPRLVVETLAQTGARLSELSGWRWGDLSSDEHGDYLAVRRGIRDGKVAPPKSRTSRRKVPVGPELLRQLKAHRLASRWSRDDDYIFASPDGRPLTPGRLYRVFKPAAERAGVGWAGPHTLRHTTITCALRAGEHLAGVSAAAGHHDVAFTLRVYGGALPSDRPSGERLAAAVGLD
jgi:integrase